MVDLRISRVEASDSGEWRFFNENGERIAQHITAGHMAQMYAEIHNEAIRLRETADHFEKFIGFVATCKRKNTYEWMRLMLDWLNGAAMRFDEAAYFDLHGVDRFVLRRCERAKAD